MRSRPKSKPAPKIQWRISRIKGTPAAELGTVEAPDAASAIKVAIEQFGITDPNKQARLMARRIAPASRAMEG